MKYKVTIDSYVLGNHLVDAMRLPPIPGTTKTMILDTNSGMGREIWYGYLQMRMEQKRQPTPPDSRNWNTVKQPETASEKIKFTEACNIFFRYMAGEGRDNGKQVTQIIETNEEAEY